VGVAGLLAACAAGPAALSEAAPGAADHSALAATDGDLYWAAQRVRHDPSGYADPVLRDLRLRRADLSRQRARARPAEIDALDREIRAVDTAIYQLLAHRAEEARKTEEARRALRAADAKPPAPRVLDRRTLNRTQGRGVSWSNLRS
jgi:hypothetical protein